MKMGRVQDRNGAYGLLNKAGAQRTGGRLCSYHFADGAFKGNAPFHRGGKIKWKKVGKKAGPSKVLPKRWVVEAYCIN